MRRGLLLGSVIGLVNAGLAISLAWWFGRPPGGFGSGDFGFYSYTPMPRRYADYLPASSTPGWTIALFLLAAFLVVNAIAVAAAVMIKSVWNSRGKS
ncbi:MAG TPA: hypothetical protein VM712_01115 [Gaiellales bacterium]|nr:hypothetical protein [Gaiellales bacterium]